MKTLGEENVPAKVLGMAREAVRLAAEGMPVVYCPQCRADTVLGPGRICLFCETKL